MNFVWAFLIGGLICTIGQILILRTHMTTARILVTFVIGGLILEAVGLFEPIKEFAGAGVTVPILGFGATLAKGAIKAVAENGALGIFLGGLTATAAGIAAAVFFAFIFALIAKPNSKK
ncbi:MAG: SpoVA/SpoVAEb family sporulation membrane protein [Firmicutes bacterium]|nr:SpoVA/SpoVAEb family sporulation membrane protein [Bacillota bacterium]